jgi:hypothetical protein
MDRHLTAELEARSHILLELGVPTLPAVWLRPEADDGSGSEESKIGGQIGWPKGKPWPICDSVDFIADPCSEQNDYLVPVAQFRRDDFPEISFPEDSDILQLLWCPRFHRPKGVIVDGPYLKAFWHAVADLEEVPNPEPSWADPGLVPNPCVWQPVWIDDAPVWRDLTAGQKAQVPGLLQSRGALLMHPTPESLQWMEGMAGSSDAARYNHYGLGTIPGTKLLGYANSDYQQAPPVCNCGSAMAHLFTASARELDPSIGAWYWRYDPSFRSETIHSSVGPMEIGALDGAVYVFYCDRCPERPVRVRTVFG